MLREVESEKRVVVRHGEKLCPRVDRICEQRRVGEIPSIQVGLVENVNVRPAERSTVGGREKHVRLDNNPVFVEANGRKIRPPFATGIGFDPSEFQPASPVFVGLLVRETPIRTPVLVLL